MNKGMTYALLTAFIILFSGTTFRQLYAEEKTDRMQRPAAETIKLPEPVFNSGTSVEQAILNRRSVRRYSGKPLTLAEISQLLWSAQGVTGKGGLRTAPSAGALYPLEIYVVAGNVTGLPEGIYKYMPGGHELKMVVKGDRRNELCGSALGQSSVKNGAAVIVFSAVPGRTTVKYGGRGIQYMHIETGHAAQNVLLQAVSLDLGTVVIGAFHDDEVKKVMNMTGTEQPLYIIPVGKR